MYGADYKKYGASDSGLSISAKTKAELDQRAAFMQDMIFSTLLQ
jgi:hypothetical protein